MKLTIKSMIMKAFFEDSKLYISTSTGRKARKEFSYGIYENEGKFFLITNTIFMELTKYCVNEYIQIPVFEHGTYSKYIEESIYSLIKRDYYEWKFSTSSYTQMKRVCRKLPNNYLKLVPFCGYNLAIKADILEIVLGLLKSLYNPPFDLARDITGNGIVILDTNDKQLAFIACKICQDQG